MFLKNHLVANIGVRYDRVRNSNFGAFQPILAATPFTPQNPQAPAFGRMTISAARNRPRSGRHTAPPRG